MDHPVALLSSKGQSRSGWQAVRHGRLSADGWPLAVVQSLRTGGTIELSAEGKGLASAKLQQIAK